LVNLNPINMTWFTSDFSKFFKGLAKNNNKDWFEANKSLYENAVKAPFEVFVEDLIKQVAKFDKAVKITPKEAIFRIYKDVRFAKDKTPYKEYVSAIIAPGGRKSMEAPGIYLQLSDKELSVFSGSYAPEKEYLHRIRLRIAANGKEWQKIVANATFKKYFGEVQGERNKIILPELKEDAAKYPIIFNKQFYIVSKMDTALLTKPTLVDEVMKRYTAAEALNQFLGVAYHGK
jgi:uncharacterized protein (TIGR02453 family)